MRASSPSLLASFCVLISLLCISKSTARTITISNPSNGYDNVAVQSRSLNHYLFSSISVSDHYGSYRSFNMSLATSQESGEYEFVMYGMWVLSSACVAGSKTCFDEYTLYVQLFPDVYEATLYAQDAALDPLVGCNGGSITEYYG